LVKPFTDLFPTYGDEGWVKVKPSGFVLPASCGEGIQKVYDMKPRPDDAWIITFPKSGNLNKCITR